MGIPGKKDATICHSGCAMRYLSSRYLNNLKSLTHSCVAMALAALDVKINGTLVNPGNIQKSLRVRLYVGFDAYVIKSVREPLD